MSSESTTKEKTDIVMENGVLEPAKRLELVEIDDAFGSLEINPTLKKIAETNKVDVSWDQLRPILINHLTKVCRTQNESLLRLRSNTIAFVVQQNELMEAKIEDENLKIFVDDSFLRIVHSISEHLGCPFTIQRFCELVIHPQRYYKMYIKYLRAVEKILQVTSYWEDYDDTFEKDVDTTMEEADTSTTTGTSEGLLFSIPNEIELTPIPFESGEPEAEDHEGESPSTMAMTSKDQNQGEETMDAVTDAEKAKLEDDNNKNTEKEEESKTSDLEVTDRKETENVQQNNNDNQTKVETKDALIAENNDTTNEKSIITDM
ncbi:protein phosphatase 4 core regulatory subunit R2 [Mycotypha africana]|uniref:protein phosphatase 4 core regulatory subunit R2 n=1 Tax=Mycotypha africana TaxID=64632 RepID=UPI0023008806|nr:protein phosphatase 4 core regulatory subunit R2 [Mycotypha africana]KAI8979288.1 protein phosphatase 4 core regulatory subunit R2 [Mycotypha africana]